MGTTSNRSYPYPAGSDAVDVPGDIQALADDVDADVAAVIAGTGLADGAVTTAKLADGAVTFAKTSGVAPATALRLPGTSGNYVSTPDSAALDITGDIEIIVAFAVASSGTYTLAQKSDVSSQRSWEFEIGSANTLGFRWSTDGSSETLVTSATLPFSVGQTVWAKVTLDVDNGASGRTITFYTSVDGASWTVLGSPSTSSGATSIYASTTDVWLGSRGNNTRQLSGALHYAEIKDGIGGTTVAKFDARAPMGPRYTDPQGNVWTINGSAWSWSRA